MQWHEVQWVRMPVASLYNLRRSSLTDDDACKLLTPLLYRIGRDLFLVTHRECAPGYPVGTYLLDSDS